MRILIIFSILIIYSYAQCTGGVTSNLNANSNIVGSVTYLWSSSKLHVCFVIADNYCMESSIISFGPDKDALVPHSEDYGCSSNINVEFDVNDNDSYLSISVRVRQYSSWLPLGGIVDIYTVTYPLDRPSGLTRPYWDSYITVNGETRDFDGNCIDYYTTISGGVEYPNVELFSFQDELAPVYPGSILRANWLANQDVKENFLYAFPTGYGRSDVQKAIWALVHNQPTLANNANSQFFLAQANTNTSALNWTGPQNPDDYDSIIAIVDGGEKQNTMFHVKLSESVVSIFDSDEDNGNDLTISGSIYEDCQNDCSKSESESTLFTGLTVKLFASDNTLLESFLSSDGTFSFTVSRNTQYHIGFDPSGTITSCGTVTVDSGSYENIVLLAFDTSSDPDGDGYGENCDICPNGDDAIDNNNNGIPDACECLIECTKYGYYYDEEACTCEPICGDGLVADVEECEPTEIGPNSPCCNSVCEFVDDSCEDGNLCIENDYCSEGVCISGETVNCDEGNACSEYSCDPEIGCVETDISDSCNGDNKCFEYSCNPEIGCVETDISSNCDGDNKCSEYSCDPEIGCVETDISSECDDNDDCTEEYCDPDFGCKYSGVDCDDSSVCTRDYCLRNGGCQYEDLSDQCNDFDVCTSDSCDPLDGCINEITITCTPRNACETAECDPIRGCVYFPIECPESSDLCKVPVCDENSGCGFEDLTCSDDGDLCTNEICNSNTGLCTSTEIICTDEKTDDCILTYCDAGICVTSSEPDCNDNNPCTIDTCDNFNCIHTPIECNSEDPCIPEVCVAGNCVATPIECPDSDADCGGSICDNGICVPKDNLTCDDGSLCTTDMCIEGECKYFENTCNDNNACTADSCDIETGECINTPIDISCESDACVERECDPETGNCIEQSIVDCNTNNACASGQCNPNTGLCEVTEFNCDDGLFCTIDICEEENGEAVCRYEQRVCPQTTDLCVANFCSEDSDSCETIDILCASDIECIEGNCVNGNCVFTRIFGCGISAVPDPSDPVAIEEPLTSSSSSSIGAVGVGLVNEGGGDSGASAVANNAADILANSYSTTVVAVGGVGLVITFAFFAAVLGFNNSKQQPEVPLDALLEQTEADMVAYDNPLGTSAPDAFLNVTSTN